MIDARADGSPQTPIVLGNTPAAIALLVALEELDAEITARDNSVPAEVAA
jgi:hypothetical protein